MSRYAAPSDLDYREACGDTPERTPPTPAQIALAEANGYGLCLDCGQPLHGVSTPEFEQLCGDCENARGEQNEAQS